MHLSFEGCHLKGIKFDNSINHEKDTFLKNSLFFPSYCSLFYSLFFIASLHTPSAHSMTLLPLLLSLTIPQSSFSCCLSLSRISSLISPLSVNSAKRPFYPCLCALV